MTSSLYSMGNDSPSVFESMKHEIYSEELEYSHQSSHAKHGLHCSHIVYNVKKP